jgi:two-component system nitrate/nitrite sensor histidine kinase NarX
MAQEIITNHSKTYKNMSASSEFFERLSALFRQTACRPEAVPAVPLELWPPGSTEQQLLGDFQAAIQAIHTHHQQIEQVMAQQMEARLREQATLLEISQILASALELKPGLILDQLRVIIGYTQAALFALEGLDLVALAVRGPQSLEAAMPFRIHLTSQATLIRLWNGHQPQRIADVQSHDPAARFLRSLLAGQTAVLLQGIHAWMWVPLAVKGEIIGGMAVAHTEPDHFTAHHADLALTMANQAAIIMINAQLHERAQAVAVLEERQRLAQNLHDAINQSLFSAGLIAEVLPRLWERDPEEALQSLEDLRRLTRGAQAEMRGLLVELKPLILTDSVLADLLHQLGNALTGRINIPVTVTVMGPEQQSLPAKVQVAFYRICQEALHNIIKHAQATQVEIQLKIEPGTIELIIRDDGRGFDPSHIPSGHYGLTMMKERAQAVNAILTITGQPGQGTVVVISWTNDLVQEHL